MFPGFPERLLCHGFADVVVQMKSCLSTAMLREIGFPETSIQMNQPGYQMSGAKSCPDSCFRRAALPNRRWR